MKAARFLGVGVDLEIAFVPVPIPGDGESLIAVKAVGLCGSDLHITQGHTTTGYTPITPGHEISGVVEEIKGPSSGICRGDRVFVNPMVGCGYCRFCTAGEVNFCPERSILGIQRDGGLAEFVVAPTANLTVMPDAVGFAEIALIESAGTANHAVRVLGVSEGDTI